MHCGIVHDQDPESYGTCGECRFALKGTIPRFTVEIPRGISP